MVQCLANRKAVMERKKKVNENSRKKDKNQPEDKQTFPCELCPYKTTQKNDLICHMRSHNSSESNEDNDKTEEPSSSSKVNLV